MDGWNAMMQASSIRSGEEHPRQPYVSSDSGQDEDDDDDVQDVPRPAAGMTRRERKFMSMISSQQQKLGRYTKVL